MCRQTEIFIAELSALTHMVNGASRETAIAIGVMTVRAKVPTQESLPEAVKTTAPVCTALPRNRAAHEHGDRSHARRMRVREQRGMSRRERACM